MVYLNFTYIPGTEIVYALPGTPEDAAQLRQRPKPDSQHFTSTSPRANEFGAKSLKCPLKLIASLDMRCKLCRHLRNEGQKATNSTTPLQHEHEFLNLSFTFRLARRIPPLARHVLMQKTLMRNNEHVLINTRYKEGQHTKRRTDEYGIHA